MNKKLRGHSKQQHFAALPFYWHPLVQRREKLFPEILPFTLQYDPRLQLLRQRVSPKMQSLLKAAYLSGSDIIGLMDQRGLGGKYAADFLHFISHVLPFKNIRGKEIMEIGCGTGYLLKKLKDQGAKVLGLEPGFDHIGKYSIPVKKAFFSSQEIAGRYFDIVIGYALLEHLAEPWSFLQAIKKHLRPKGMLLLSVPDCEEPIRNGDVSMLLHEHYSYFSLGSLRYVLTSAGFRIKFLRKSGFGGCVYAAVTFDPAAQRPKAKIRSTGEKYFTRVRSTVKALQAFLKHNAGKEVAVYVPLRAMNALYLLKKDLNRLKVKLRFIDDAPGLTGKYLPGFNTVIENRQELLARPPDLVLVYSYTFGRAIAAELNKKLSGNVLILAIADIIKQN